MATRRRPPGNRGLSDEEKQLWDQVAGQAKPLRGGKSKMAAPPPPEPARSPVRVSKSRAYIPPNQPAHRQDKPLSTGAYANIDRSTAERFRKGQYPIDATLDLHGM